MSALADRPENPVVGHRAPHESAALHVTGAAMYTDDIAAQTAGVLTAWPVQSTSAHARVTIDVSGAYEVPGVVRVLTADDVPGLNDAGIRNDEPLFPSEAMFYGHALVWVLGETTEAARLGAERVKVEYDELPSLITVHDAIEAQSFMGTPRTVERGDATAALATSTHVFEGVTEFAGQEHFYLETHASFAVRDSEGQYFIQCSTQHPTETQDLVSHVLGIHANEVTVQCLRMGGGFGGKEMQPHGFAAVAALGAKLTGRPVRVRLNRTQDLTMTGKRHPFHISWKVGLDENGMLQALDAVLTADGAGRSTCRSRCWAARSATSTTPTGYRTCTPMGASRRRTSSRTPRTAASAARRACSSSRTSWAGSPRRSASIRSSCAAATSTSPVRARRTVSS